MVRSGNESRSALERVARGSSTSSGATGRPRQRPDRLLADKGPVQGEPCLARDRGIASQVTSNAPRSGANDVAVAGQGPDLISVSRL